MREIASPLGDSLSLPLYTVISDSAIYVLILTQRNNAEGKSAIIGMSQNNFWQNTPVNSKKMGEFTPEMK